MFVFLTAKMMSGVNTMGIFFSKNSQILPKIVRLKSANSKKIKL